MSPDFYRSNWFWVIGIAVGLGGLGLLHLLRISQVRAEMEGRLVEKDRIAQELLDALLQDVLGLILKIHAVVAQLPGDEPARQTLGEILDHADRILSESADRVRTLLGTEPFNDLPAAFNRIAHAAAPDGRASLKVVVKGSVRALHAKVLEGAFSIGREALINALRHSQALHVEVEIAYHPKQFCLRVRDDGHGMDSTVLQQGGRPDHWGLLGMREHAQAIGAQLRVWSRPEAGTEVELRVPGTTAYRSMEA
jgi:signal transduction histidine kinase